MDKNKLFKDVACGIGTATLWTVKQTAKAAAAAADYVYDHRAEIAKGARLTGSAAVSSVKGAATFAYDTASLKVFSKEKIEGIRERIEAQGREYRSLVDGRSQGRRLPDSLAVGGDLLSDILAGGSASTDVHEAYAAAYRPA